jgi:hypothetical protein
MNTQVPESDVQVSHVPEPDRRKPRRPKSRRLLVGTTVLVLAVAGGVITVADPFGGEDKAPGPVGGGSSLATVREGPLSSQVSQSGTLSYAARNDGTPFSVVNQADGIYTWVPSAGKVIKCGQILYWVADTPVSLLCGTRPAYRDLSYGNEGWDVRALNKALVELGYAKRSELDPDSDYFSSKTAEALKELQDKIGADETGTLKLGEAVFQPGPLRITKSIAKLGTRAAPGAPVLEAATTARQVTVELDASQQSAVKVGDRAQIILPDNRTTSGKVSRIGTVASSSGDNGSGSDSGSGSSSATIPIYITLNRPKDAGSLDQAPVRVQITTAGVKQALIVPVTALVGHAGGEYAVEKVNAQGVHQTVPVTLGLFDNADGLVQVTGNLTAGDQVVVPAT